MIDNLNESQVYELTALGEPYAVALADAVVLKRLDAEIKRDFGAVTLSPHALSCWLHDNHPGECRAALHRAVVAPETPAEDALRLAVIEEMAARKKAEAEIEMEEAV